MVEAVPTFGKEWSSLKPRLSEAILDAVSSMGFENMTPVQEATIPAFVKNSDIVVEAATGSGKTLAFVIPVLEILHRRNVKLKHIDVGAIIISPTRELAKQIFEVLDQVIRLSGYEYKAHLVVGGSATATDTADELSRMKEMGPDILVGTPGRLEDVLCGRRKNGKKTKSGTIMAVGGVRGRPSASAAKLEVLVMDEADRLLDMGFEASLTAILSMLPKQRRTGLFSATMSEALSELVRAGLRNPVRVQVQVRDRNGAGNERSIPSTLSIRYLICPPDRKLAQIFRLIRTNEAQKYIIYFSTCAAVDYFFKLLQRVLSPRLVNFAGSKKAMKEERDVLQKYLGVDFDISVHALHGQMMQKRREATYAAFSAIPSGEAGILLCTDVASRGLDIPDVDCVIQWDPPTDPKSFAHRCGRTARAGRSGQALVFLNPGSEETYVELLALRKVPMAPADYLWQNDAGDLTTVAPAGTSVTGRLSDDELSRSEDEEEEEADCEADAEEGNTNNTEKKKKKKKKYSSLRIKYPEDTHSDKLLNHLRDIIATDRDIYKRGNIAFVSFVQAYSKHTASYIFRQKELPIIEVAKGFALLHLPSMPEMRGRPTAKFERYKIDTNTIPYLDAKRETQRLAKLEAAKAAKEEEARLKNIQSDEAKKKKKAKKDKNASNSEAWSEKKEAKMRSNERKLKRLKKRDACAHKAEALLLENTEDPKIREMLARDPLLAKRMLSGRDKSLRDASQIAANAKKMIPALPAQSLEAIIDDARKRTRAKDSDSDGSTSSSDEDSWEAIARKEKIRVVMASKTKKKRRFVFNPGFSDEEAENN
ncbi:ATP-dependent rRNA helicase spb4 [Coemansia sp. RSA 1813]|nr:ATP-dependent rRNA helicase spb4 [Coemansia sp. RSA 1646]KAJ1772715.1 ATP-dependent rRNA helicase spb4 [Coemansia sp. RSA 1843]KAJ2090665.1 ATP-dependent rRNA helicase spb4 [Coemansia sp. RSA 986]KAJ2216130.1 ATP-dependent rRNA helicase spb4 [Coemansia sp. RSA 487]KAJ2570117.1 ATP-dependent rRNA helicase spb4 [Coemansia sp. RSA 1813]